MAAHICFSTLFHFAQLLAPDIRHERNVLLQCVRYVVRNNFFGLESRPQNQEGLKDTPTAAILTGEHEKRQEQKLKEDGVEPQSACLSSRMGCSAEAGNQENFKRSEAAVAEQNCQHQVWPSNQMDSEPSKDIAGDTKARAEQVTVDFIHVEDTAAKDGHSLDLSSSDKITCTSHIYDDEIW